MLFFFYPSASTSIEDFAIRVGLNPDIVQFFQKDLEIYTSDNYPFEKTMRQARSEVILARALENSDYSTWTWDKDLDLNHVNPKDITIRNTQVAQQNQTEITDTTTATIIMEETWITKDMAPAMTETEIL